VFIGRTSPTIFTCCLISETGTGGNAGPTVLVGAQEGWTREEAMLKMVEVSEETAVKKIVRAERWDEVRRKKMAELVVTGSGCVE
jgi:hypothetical protein